MGNPEEFLERAGTVWRQTTAVTQPASQPGIISAVLFNQHAEMPRHTTRSEEFPRIDPNEVRSLPVGHAFVIAEGKAQRVAVAEVTDLYEQVSDLHDNIEPDNPYIGGMTLLEMGRDVLRLRREAYADLATPEAAGDAPPPPPLEHDPDLDF